jgi:hypothetical protein
VLSDGLVEASLLAADAWQRRGVATFMLARELGSACWTGARVAAFVVLAPSCDQEVLRCGRTPR